MLLKAFHLPCQELIDYAYYMLTIRLLPGMDYVLVSNASKGWNVLAPWGLHRHLLPGQSQQTNAASLASSIFKLFSLFSMSELEIEVQCAIKEFYFRILELRHTKPTLVSMCPLCFVLFLLWKPGILHHNRLMRDQRREVILLDSCRLQQVKRFREVPVIHCCDRFI